MKGGLGNILKQAQQMQENMQKAQEELANIEVEGQAGGGMVSVTMSCRHEVKRINIEDNVMKDDKDIIEDLVAAAMNDALRKVEKKTQDSMSGMASGLNLPPGMKLPF